MIPSQIGYDFYGIEKLCLSQNIRLSLDHLIHQIYEHEKTCIFRQINCPDSSCEKQVLFKDIHEHVNNDHKLWALNLPRKIDEKTFNVMYAGFIVGAR